MKKSRKKFIKKAHSAACSEWKKNIEAEFPNLFETKSFKKGDWVVTGVGAVINVQEERVCNFLAGLHIFGYGIDSSGDWVDGYVACPSDCRLVTEEEVEKALIAEAKKRGFKKGVKVNQDRIWEKKGLIVSIFSNNFEYYRDDNGVYLNGYTVFKDGKWAEIVETITKEQAEKELGKTIIG